MSKPKQATSVSLTAEQRRAIDEVRAKRARGDDKPSIGVIVREALDEGLPRVLSAESAKAT
jgi:hypothetical protein